MFTSNEVVNIEFSRPSSCGLLKSNFSMAQPISEVSTCEAPNVFLNSANLITRTNSTGLKYLQLYKDMCRKMSVGLLKCIRKPLSAHFVKKSTLKSNIKRISKAQSPKLAQGWGRGMGITTQIPRNLSVRQWREHCHIDFLLRIHVTKMLQGIYISLRSAGNLFSGRCAHAILF